MRLMCRRLGQVLWLTASITAQAHESGAAPAAGAGSAASAPAAEPTRRPRIGLVLSGGGARGLAHVGVLKMLERERIPIDVIAGTSMGAIIGGLYASGMSAERLEKELLAIKWDEVFASRVDRPLLSQRRKEEDFELSPVLEFGMRDGELRAPLGALSGRGLESLLRRYTLPVRGVRDFSKLAIPFRAVATNLETGQPVVLDRGDLALALRSSMSVPGFFAPTEVDGHILGDGGLVDNLPIDVARAMGADIVIAVNIGTPLSNRAALSSVTGLTTQMLSILTEQNVARSLAMLKPRDGCAHLRRLRPGARADRSRRSRCAPAAGTSGCAGLATTGVCPVAGPAPPTRCAAGAGVLHSLRGQRADHATALRRPV